MKSLSHLFLWVALPALGFVACERHEFEKTQILHRGHGGHHDEGHGEKHGGSDKAHAGDHSESDKPRKDAANAADEAKPKPAPNAEPRDTVL